MQNLKILLNNTIKLLFRRKKVSYLLILAVVLVSAVLFLLLSKGIFFKPEPLSTTPKLVQIVNPAEETIIEITGTGFFPQTVKIKKGSQVTWLNNDTKPHRIKSDPHPLDNLNPFLNTEEGVLPNESVSIPVEQTGTLTYHDEENPLEFKGIIIVE